MRNAFLVIILFSASLSFAKTRIAFLEQYDRNGNRVQYEPGGRFVHSAIQFDEIGDRWLNAYPGEGVAVISLEQLQHHGTIAEVVEIPQTVHMSQVKPYLGLPFDFWYEWSDDAIYCSELIAKILDIPTRPMKINKQVWPKNYWHLEGQPGLSPDALYEWALKDSTH